VGPPRPKSTNNKQIKGNMQNKPKKKEEKKDERKESKVHDLKPSKDPKGGAPPGPCGPRVQRPSNQNT
jgi:hypothetical protein